MNSDLPPLHLNRINRLIRPLRAILKSLTLSIDLEQSRSLAISQQPHQILNNKGKSKAVDQDYDSPFNQTKRKKHHAKSTYGNSKRGGSNQASGRAGTGSTASTNKIVASVDVRDRLKAGGLDEESTNKALLLFRCFKNVLEAVHGIGINFDGSSRRGIVPSLVEIVSKEVGWSIEDAVRNCLMEAEDARDDLDVENLLSSGHYEKGTNRKKGSFGAEEEDENKLVSDWYETVPEYCRRWIFSQHATCIAIDALESYSPILLLILLEMSSSIGALAEASRFLPPLIQLSLSASPNSNIRIKSHDLYLISSNLSQSEHYLSFLRGALLASSFSDRYFYSEFLSLSHISLRPSKEGKYVSQLLALELDIAGEMLESMEVVAEESNNDMSSTEHLATEVINRLRKELEISLPIIFNRQYKSISNLQAVSSSLFDVIENFSSVANQDLAPIAVVLELMIISVALRDFSSTDSPPVDLAIHLSRISYLTTSIALFSQDSSPPSSQCTSSMSDSIVNSNALNYLLRTLPYLSTQDIASISSLLHSSSLYQFESMLLSKVLAATNYSLLVDVASSDLNQIDDFVNVIARDVFEERLLLSQAARLEEDDNVKVENYDSLGGSSSTIKGGDGGGEGVGAGRKKWRWESMVGSYVVSTPSTIANSSKKIKPLQEKKKVGLGSDFKGDDSVLQTSPSRIMSTPSSLSFSSLGRNNRSTDGFSLVGTQGGINRRKGDIGTPSKALGSSVAKRLWATRKVKESTRTKSYWESSEGGEPEEGGSEYDGEVEEEVENWGQEEASDNDHTQSPSPPVHAHPISDSSAHSPYSYDRKRKIEVLDLSIDSDYDTRLLFDHLSSQEEVSDIDGEDNFRLEVLERPLSPTTPSEPDEFVLSQTEVQIPKSKSNLKKLGSKKEGKVKRRKIRRELEGSDDELGM